MPSKHKVKPTAAAHVVAGEIRYCIAPCNLGHVLVAATEQGICALVLGDDEQSLVRELAERFPRAQLSEDRQACRLWAKKAAAFLKHPSLGLDLPLDLHGTAFQRKVWKSLQGIPAGATASYAQVARKIGTPTAVRAVASACAANPVALAIPCHRVVRTDGSLGGYRWGIDRKRMLLRREAEPG